MADGLYRAANVHLTTDPLLVNVMFGMISCRPNMNMKFGMKIASSANLSLVTNPSVQFSALPPKHTTQQQKIIIALCEVKKEEKMLSYR